MARIVTARAAAGKTGLPRGAQTISPYRRGMRGMPVWVEVVAARRVGCHVELRTGEGKRFLVDLLHPIFPVSDDEPEEVMRSQAGPSP